MVCKNCGKEFSLMMPHARHNVTGAFVCMDCMTSIPREEAKQYSVSNVAVPNNGTSAPAVGTNGASPQTNPLKQGMVQPTSASVGNTPGMGAYGSSNETQSSSTVWISIAKAIAVLDVIGMCIFGGIVGSKLAYYSSDEGLYTMLGVLAGFIVGMVVCSGLMVFADMAQDIRAIKNHLENDRQNR